MDERDAQKGVRGIVKRKKNVSVFDMNESEVREQIGKDFARWDQIMREGCADPTWPDGVNLNLVRNHIINDYGQLKRVMEAPVQLSLFDVGMDMTGLRPIPPELPDGYMVRNGTYAHIRVPRFQSQGKELVFDDDLLEMVMEHMKGAQYGR